MVLFALLPLIINITNETSICNVKSFFFFWEFCHDYSPNLLACLHFAKKITTFIHHLRWSYWEKLCLLSWELPKVTWPWVQFFLYRPLGWSITYIYCIIITWDLIQNLLFQVIPISFEDCLGLPILRTRNGAYPM